MRVWLESHIYRSDGYINSMVSSKPWWVKHGYSTQLETIFRLTSFLEYDAIITKRIYYIINNIAEQKKCYCGNPVNIATTYCSNKCSSNSKLVREKNKKTHQMKYGIDHYSKTKEYKEKVKKTCQERYGVDHHFKTINFRKKYAQSCVESYGIDHYSKTKEYKEKVKKTCQERYGVDHYTQTNEYKMQSKKTCQERYGVDHYTQTNKFIIKNEETSLEKFGETSYSKTKEYKTRVKENSLEKFGETSYSKTKEYKEKVKKTCQLKYKRDSQQQLHISKFTLGKLNNPEWLKKQNHILKKTCGEIAEELGDVTRSTVGVYFHKYNISIDHSYSTSVAERDLAEFISSIYDGEIITNTRAVISPLEIDIYIPGLNTAFEYNGEYWHKETNEVGMGKPVGYHRTKTSLCRTKGIKLYHIWERHWANERNKIERMIKKILI